MRCPVCVDESLVISSREGIEIDHCPQCRGVWLDRGELDKIIDRAAPAVVGARSSERDRDDRGRDDRDRYDDRGRDDRGRGRDRDDRRPRKKRSFLEDIFDFD
jgi:Zn-finger nucleic acid-binding protein